MGTRRRQLEARVEHWKIASDTYLKETHKLRSDVYRLERELREVAPGRKKLAKQNRELRNEIWKLKFNLKRCKNDNKHEHLRIERERCEELQRTNRQLVQLIQKEREDHALALQKRKKRSKK